MLRTILSPLAAFAAALPLLLATVAVAQNVDVLENAASNDAAAKGWTDEELATLAGRFGSNATFAAAHLRVDDLEVAPFADALNRIVELNPEEQQQALAALRMAKEAFGESGLHEILFLVGFHPTRQVAVTAIVSADRPEAVMRLPNAANSFPHVERRDGLLILRTVNDDSRTPLADTGAIREAFASAGDAPARGVLFLPDDLRRVLGELAFALDDEQAVAVAELLAKELKWATAAIEPERAMTVNVRLRFDSPEGAQAMQDQSKALLDRGLDFAREQVGDAADMPEGDKLLDAIEKFRALMEPTREENSLVLSRSLDDPETLAALRDFALPSVLAMRAASQIDNGNKLKQIAIGFHNFHDTYGHLPLVANQKKEGKSAGLSWRVHLLPYLDQYPLYNEFKLDEPWDSAHNKALIEKMPDIYRLGADLPPGKTNALIPLGEGYAFSGDEPTGFRDVTDGTSNTIFVVQASPQEAVIWTRPDADLPVDLTEIAGQLGVEGQDSFQVMIGDGSVRRIVKSIDKDLLQALFTRAGGEVAEAP